MRRGTRPVYHLLWICPLVTVVLMAAAAYVFGGPDRPASPGGWWPIIAVAAALSLGQVAALFLIYRRMRWRYLQHRAVASRHRQRVREKLKDVRTQAEQLATEDAMTGLFNRRYMERHLAAEFERSRRYRQPFSCAMLDGDLFKRVNDLYGHPAGDRVIRDMAAILQGQARQSDLLGHYGGDEFLLLMPNTPLDAAGRLAERIRRVLADHARQIGGHEVVTTCSIGIACYDGGEDLDGAENLLDRADRAMYEAKRRGRNRVCLWGSDGVRYPDREVSDTILHPPADPDTTADQPPNGE